jgi:N6-L-threonylcarbamoyladenine synthase
MKPLILAIESSCDDTSAAVMKDGQILSNITHTQSLHEKYGGVVPELASRAHQAKILPTIEEALHKANVSKHDLDALAVTRGPGLLGSLLVGVTTAKSMALALRVPLIDIHHMHAHVLAHFIEEPKPRLPFLCLTVSGGHTQIIKVSTPLKMEVLGKTIDDAAGEAFDKSGKMLGLKYPAGPEIDRLAKEGAASFQFNKPQIEGLDFSFSGLKTSILYQLRKRVKEDPDFVKKHLSDICASIQQTIVEILIDKIIMAAELHGIEDIAIAGGVSANSGLRKAFLEIGQQKGWNTYIPKFEYCTDNAAMIAMAAHFKFLAGEFADQSISPMPRWAF